MSSNNYFKDDYIVNKTSNFGEHLYQFNQTQYDDEITKLKIIFEKHKLLKYLENPKISQNNKIKIIDDYIEKPKYSGNFRAKLFKDDIFDF
jgi:F0F1-type ATP synthase delta subunit